MGLHDSVTALHAGLDYHLARHNLLVSNLTHVDTPNYKPVDLQRAGGTFDSSLQVALRATEPSHFGTQVGDARAEPYRVVEDPGATVGADGNGVSVDREAAKIAANQIRYETLASLVSNELSGLEWAATDGGRP
jgi:flagellar basal-body rod protein FlgB